MNSGRWRFMSDRRFASILAGSAHDLGKNGLRRLPEVKITLRVRLPYRRALRIGTAPSWRAASRPSQSDDQGAWKRLWASIAK